MSGVFVAGPLSIFILAQNAVACFRMKPPLLARAMNTSNRATSNSTKQAHKTINEEGLEMLQ